MDKTNSRNKAISVSKPVSSILYTNIPNQKFKSDMGELIDFCFNDLEKTIHLDH